MTGITGVGSQYNRYTHSEGFKENINSVIPKYEERNYQTKSPNEREYPKSSYKSPYVSEYSPYSNKGNVSGSREQGSGTKLRQMTVSEAKSVGLPINSNKKYYGDPKVKSIIEEFYRNKKQRQESSASKPLQTESKCLISLLSEILT